MIDIANSSDPTQPLIVGVVGAGTMGAGIAQVSLLAGHEVHLHDVDQDAIERGRKRIRDGLQRLVDKGRLTPPDSTEMMASLHDAHSLEGLAQEADVVIEAALEDIDLKRTIFLALAASARDDAVLATNTSALNIADIAAATAHPELVLGLHFFNPAPVMPLVEVVTTQQTDHATIDRAVNFVVGLGKEPIVCRDSPGFIVNRVNRPFTLEALRMLESEEAGVQEIDRAVQSAGYPMGPLALMDLVGIDVNFAVATAIWHGFDEEIRFTPSRIQEGMVSVRRLGRKTGEGFYRYEDGRPTGLSPALSQVGIHTVEGTLAADEIVRRIELAIINEAYHAAGDGVADPRDIDRAMKLGASHPHGPFERAAELGLRTVIDGLSRLQGIYGERFSVAPALWQVASM
ncbi:MAG: 3-hydroxyacyl-CoA dehydrogenase NAD-binding domain-containing protein [Candidatus Limnocylindrales bacterium]